MTQFAPPLTRVRRILAFTLLAACAGMAHAGKKPPGAWDPVSATTSHSLKPVATDDTVNPMRGFHMWQNQFLAPVDKGTRDAFRRYYWRDFETSEGVYNFTLLIEDMKKARDNGRKFAFRLRMMAGYADTNELFTPAHMVGNPQCLSGCGFWYDANPADAGGKTFIPDWNDPYVIARSRALLGALKTRIEQEGLLNSIAWIDVGMYGQYGEFVLQEVYGSQPPGITKVTPENKREYAKMHFDIFPEQQHVMFVPFSNEEVLDWGLRVQTITTKPVGLRVDCLSQDGYFKQWSDRSSHWIPFENQWKKAPFVAEFCPFKSPDLEDPLDNPATARAQAAFYHISTIGNGNFQLHKPDADRFSTLTPQDQSDLLMLGREMGYRYGVERTVVTVANGVLNFTATIRNDGNAPTYEPWSVRVELVNSSGAVSWTGLLGAFNLNTLYGAGSSQMVQASFTLPALAAGNYQLRMSARDTRPSTVISPARAPLFWINDGATSDGFTVRTLVRR
jgi:hypothetical protein